MSFDLRQIRALMLVARHGGFSKAAREARITQPTLSTHIRNLEDEIGVRLLDRAGKAVTLTPAGVVFADYARRILDLCDQSLEAVQTYLGEVKGRVSIAASTVPGEYLLPRWLAGFAREYPQVELTLTVGDSQMVMERVASGDAAIGVSGTESSHSALTSKLLVKDEIILVRADSDPGDGESIPSRLSLNDLADLPLIRREAGSGTQLTVERYLKRAGLSPDGIKWSATLGSTRAVVEGVLAGMGAGFLSRLTVEKELSEGRLARLEIEGMDIRRGFFLVTPTFRSLSPVAQIVVGDLLDYGGNKAAQRS